MAEDADPESKTEDPSAKRLSEAADKGNVARSQEVGYWFTFLAAAVALWMLPEMMGDRVVRSTRVFFEQPHRIPVDASHLSNVLIDLFVGMSSVMMPVLGLFMVFSLAGSVLQNPPHFSLEKIKPNFSKLSPMKGLKRIFSLQGLFEFVKNILKVTILGSILFAVIWPELDSLEALVDLDPAVLIPLCLKLVMRLIGVLIAVMFVIAVADYAYQKYNFLKNLRMTKQEVKDEHKETEGDPLIKAKLRQIRMQRVRKRMMAAVPEASVVVTNPTHYAIALKYDPGKMDAPTVVAKGVDVLARRIREIAMEHKVPIVENPPLARALYKVELDDPIPIEHYKAVAGVISYVMKLKDGLAAEYRPEAG